MTWMARTPKGRRRTWSALCAAGAALVTGSATAGALYDNGPFVTNPTGGTGGIAGLPISQADSFMIPGNPLTFSTTGVNASFPRNTAVAEDFTVPAAGWNLDDVTLFAFQTGQTTATVHTIRINLWDATPYSAGSPGAPDPLPQPLLAASLVLPAGPGTFVAHRQSATSTSTVRPVYAYTVSLDDLPNAGVLSAGTYWLEWSFEGALSPSDNVFIPLVSPRDSVTNHNARLFNSIDGSAGGPRIWFEGREGFSPGVSDGRAYALPFVLGGTVVPEPASAALLLVAMSAVRRRR